MPSMRENHPNHHSKRQSTHCKNQTFNRETKQTKIQGFQMNNLFPLLICLLMTFLGHIDLLAANIQKVPIKTLKETRLDMNSYTLQVPDLPKPGPASLTTTLINGKKTKMLIAIDEQGFVIDHQGRAFQFITYSGYGEPIEVLIQRCNKRGRHLKGCLYEGHLFHVPNPLEVIDKHGHRIELIAVAPTGNEFLVHITGFQPKEVVHMHSQSCDEVMSRSIAMENNGSFAFAYAPAVVGKKEGPFKLTISNDNCNLTLQHYWGAIAFTPPDKYSQLKSKFSQ